MLTLIHSHTPNRLWYSNDYFDLIIWVDSHNAVEAFQLCYDIERFERVLSWSKQYGYSHSQIDGGEQNPFKNQAPLFVADGIFEGETILARFEEASIHLPDTIRDFVIKKISLSPH